MSRTTRAFAKAAGKARQAVSALSGKVGILNALEGEHQELSILVDRLVESGRARDHATADELLEVVRRQLLIHSEAEESVFYRTLAELERSRAWVEHHEATHQEIADVLDELERLPVSDAAWSSMSIALRDALDDHIDDEEGELFEIAQDVLSSDQLRELGARYGECRHGLSSSFDPGARSSNRHPPSRSAAMGSKTGQGHPVP
jgi:hypothetical protein